MPGARNERIAEDDQGVSSRELPVAELPDAELVSLCQSQLPYNTSAYEVLIKRHEAEVYRSCLRYLGEPSDAEDACQDAFLRVYHNIKKFDGRSLFRTWLFRIVANICSTKLSKRRAYEDKTFAYSKEVIAVSETASETEVAGLGEGFVAAAFEQLSRADKAVLSLRHILGLSVPEVSEALKLRLSATKMRLHRAEQRLKVLYETLVQG